MLLTGCGYGKIEGTVVDKNYRPQTVTTNMMYTGKFFIPQTIVHPERWSIRLKKEESRRDKNYMDRGIGI